MTFRFEVWPAESERVITQPFGANPDYYRQFDLPGHDGVDVRAPDGSRVFSVAPGQVIRVHTNPYDHNYGIHVYIRHSDGYVTGYAHLAQALVQVDEQVGAGTVIGLADHTGNSFGNHLHITLKREGVTYQNWPYNIVDPTPFMLPLLGWTRPAGPAVSGWMLRDSLYVYGDLGQVALEGAMLWVEGEDAGRKVPGGTLVSILGPEKEQFILVDVAQASLGAASAEPAAEAQSRVPQPTVATVDGWAHKPYLFTIGDRAVVRAQGIHLRAGPQRSAASIGIIGSGSVVRLLGAEQGDYAEVRARRQDFVTDIAVPLPELPDPETGPTVPDVILGWVEGVNLTIEDDGTAVVKARFGANLYMQPDRDSGMVGIVKGYARVRIGGKTRGDYVPIVADSADIILVEGGLGPLVPPQPLDPDAPTPGPVTLPPDTTPGWLFSADLRNESGGVAEVKAPGVVLRANPRRDADPLGFVPGGTRVIIMGPAQGEFTPVRVDDTALQPYEESDPVEPVVTGSARFGLHASADPLINDAEVALFRQARPAMIKVMSSHAPEGIRKLVAQHPDAQWVVRTFLEFGGRAVTPAQFVDWTLSDTRRTLNVLAGKDVVIELHNEPNITLEGWKAAWQDGASFTTWWLEVLRRYRQALPGLRFIYPGLSPGGSNVLRQDHVQFIEASRAAVDAADGLAIHTYWSHVYAMDLAVRVVDDYITRFRNVPIWITEAGNGSGQVSAAQKGAEYIAFWSQMRARPAVKGITYFVASSINPEFKHWVWLGTDIGRIVGQR